FFLFFFFFQAEDGIRDDLVTGVQTCALPISCELYDLPTLWQIASHNPWLSVTPVSELGGDPAWAADYPDVTPPRGLHLRQTGKRSEERRVGKEGRSRRERKNEKKRERVALDV